MSYFKYGINKICYEEYGNGDALILLHGNTMSSKFFAPVIPQFAKNYHVITLDFLGCGKSDRIDKWPTDLWYEWSRQVVALINKLQLSEVKLIGCSGGALVAINVVLENPELVDYIVADSFEGLTANSEITEQIRTERNFAKQNQEFCSMQKLMHGEDWEKIFEADTETVIAHAKKIKTFIHKPIDELKVNILLTGSNKDEMFTENHYKKLFNDICNKTNKAEQYIFTHGKHPAMMSNMNEFVTLCDKFFKSPCKL